MKQREPWLVGLLGLVTIFVYSIIWWYRVQKEIKEETNNGIMAVGHLCIMLVPVVNIIYYIYWISTIDRNIAFLGAPKGNRAWAYILLSLIGLGPFIVFPMIQAKINSIGTVDVYAPEDSNSQRASKYSKYFNIDDRKK